MCGAQRFAAGLAEDPNIGKEDEAPWIAIKSTPHAVAAFMTRAGAAPP